MNKFYVSGYSFFEVLFEIFPIAFFVGVLLLIISRVVLCLLLFNSLKDKIDKKWKWCVVVLGIIGAIAFFIFNNKNINKYTKKLTITKCLSVVVLDLFFAAVCFGICNYENSQWLSYSNEAHCEKYILKNNDDKRVVYDKMGNEYLVDSLQYNYDGIDDFFYYYAENGDAYLFEYNIDKMEDEPRYVCSKTNDIIYSDQAYIDSNGFLVKNTDKLEDVNCEDSSITYFKDEYGNYYFSPYNCSWNSNGNLIFTCKQLSELNK